MEIEIRPLRTENISQFKNDMQEAFQQGAVNHFNNIDIEILPESHIDRSLNTNGSYAFEATVNDELVGGAIVVINEVTQHNHLDFLYTKSNVHDKGIGQALWKYIETHFPDTVIWETATPYFERRNIHFYVNKCGFYIVEYFNRQHPDPNDEEFDDLPDIDYFADFFRFEKKMR